VERVLPQKLEFPPAKSSYKMKKWEQLTNLA